MASHYANLDGVLAILTKAEFFEAGSALLDNLRLAHVVFGSPVSKLHHMCGRLPPGRTPSYLKGTMRTADTIVEKLNQAFAPDDLRVLDESAQHQGHAGHRPGGESHFRIYIVAQAFKGKSRIECHRLINDVLATELRNGVHALAIHASAPGEQTR
jgi:BolA family transcriptional regulator, general stress-responsive regulator